MNTISRTLSGAVIGIFGIYIVVLSVSERGEGWLWGLGWGVALIILGAFIFFNKKEDDIEEIKK